MKPFSRLSIGERAFHTINILFMVFISVVTIYPFWYIFVASFSDPSEVVRAGGLMVWFKGFDLYAYKEVFAHRLFWSSYKNTLIYLSCGLTVNMAMTTLAAYALSRRNIKGQFIVMKAIVFTMFFSGGMIPTYLIVNNLKMTDTLWSQFIPYAINAYNLILLRTAFNAVPYGIEEAAIIDGASSAQVMLRIILPLALPSIMVIGLYYTEEIWNSYFRALIYIRSSSKYPLQLVLQEVLLYNTKGQSDMSFVNTNIHQTVKYATIIVSTLPVLMVYPFIQRFFVQGVMIGSIKG